MTDLQERSSQIFEVHLRAMHWMFGRMATFAILGYPDPKNTERAGLWWESYGPQTPHVPGRIVRGPDA